VAVVAVLLAVLWASRLTPAPIFGDGIQNLRLALNLAHEGVASLDQEAPFRPSMAREPVPIVIDAALIKVIDAFAGQAPADQYFAGPRATILKLQNFVWLGLLCALAVAALRLFTSSPLVILAGLALINVPLLQQLPGRYLVDSLNTESLAAALLMLCSLLLVRDARRRNARSAVAAGVVFAALVLVKAAFLYVFVGIALIFAALLLAVALRARARLGWEAARLVLFVAAFCAAVSPWFYRNYSAFDTLMTTERGGQVLHLRALEDRMTPDEIRGAFYYWAPWPLGAVVRRILGFSSADLERGGRLQRLNRWEGSSFFADDIAAQNAGRPEDAISFFRQNSGEFQQIRNGLVARGHPQPTLEADRILRERAMDMIKERPFRHLAMTVVFLWRGAFVAFPLLALALAFAVRRRAWMFALLVLPAFGMVMFYGLFSHFMSRYSIPVLPMAIVAATIALVQLRQRAAVTVPARSRVARHLESLRATD
jgi:4-amino-4-deoxy-L-arabinose transferase-like glycosyltransferase